MPSRAGWLLAKAMVSPFLKGNFCRPKMPGGRHEPFSVLGAAPHFGMPPAYAVHLTACRPVHRTAKSRGSSSVPIEHWEFV
jgi:hypothetical protein